MAEQSATNTMTAADERSSTRRGWFWVPTLYFAEAIPNVAVVTLSIIMYKNFGLGNEWISLLSSILYLPWVFKFIWSPFVDIMRTKRWWVLTMQWVIAAILGLIALSLPLPGYVVTATVFLWVMAFASATHDIAADGFYMLALSTHAQSIFVGIRSLFYRLASLVGQGGVAYMAGCVSDITGSQRYGWMAAFAALSVMFFLLSVYHTFALPRPSQDCSRDISGSSARIWSEMGRAISTFFRKPGIVAAIFFLLLYRLPEAQLAKMIIPFLLDSAECGGLGLTTKTVGLVYGTVGAIGIISGGIIGGIVAAYGGLKRWIMPMAVSMSVCCLSFVYLSYATDSPLWVVNLCVFIEQFGYGFGFTAYMLYMLYFAVGEYKTSHYAICTAFMALSLMLPGFFVGFLQVALGYRTFFIWTLVCCAATILTARFIKIDPEFGKK